MGRETILGVPAEELRTLLNAHAPAYKRGWICFCDDIDSADNYPLNWTAHMLGVLRVAAEAAGLPIGGPDDVVVSRAALDDALERAQLWQLNNGQRGKTPHDEEAAEARRKLVQRLAAPQAQERPEERGGIPCNPAT